MSTLSLSIIALVAVVIGAVILFNFWQSRVNRREAERLFRQETGALDEQAGIARRRRQSFSRPPSEDGLPGEEAITIPLYADGRTARTEPSLRDEGDWEAAATAGAGHSRNASDDAAAQSLTRGPTPAFEDHEATVPLGGNRRPPRSVDAVAPRPTTAPAGKDDALASAHAFQPVRAVDRDVAAQEQAGLVEPTTTPVALPEGIDPTQREALGRYADDLRRITERMPASAPAPPMSAKASVAPSADAGQDDPAEAFPARDSLPPMAVSPAAAAVYLGADGAAGPGSTVAQTDPRGPAGDAGDAGEAGDTMAALAAPLANAAPAGLATGNAAADHPDPRFPSVELTIVLEPANPVNADRLIALGSSLRHAGSKPVRLEIDRGDGVFVPLQSGVMVSRLQLSVLLANRQGPLNAVELSDFMSALGTFAQQIGASFTPPDLNQVLGRARAVDALAAELDTQVEILVECPERLAPTQFAALGRRLDLYDRGGSRFACLNDGGEVLYLMTPGDRPGLIRFTLDVPRVTVDNDPWRSLVSCATRCAEAVGGRVIDSEGRGLSVGMIDAVSRQLARRHEELTQAGLTPGSAAALRVFN